MIVLLNGLWVLFLKTHSMRSGIKYLFKDSKRSNFSWHHITLSTG